jgi:hypothetical protein
MSRFLKLSRKKIIPLVSIGLFILIVGVVSAGTLSLQADYSCDNITDLDDYTVLVKEKRLSTRKLSLLFKEWGKRGISDLPECEGRAVTSVSNVGGSSQNNGTPTPTVVSSPTPTQTPDSVITLNSVINLTDPNLVAYFPMEEASGKLINKKVSNSAANLIPQGQISYRQTGRVGSAIKVNGAGNAFCSGSGSSCGDVKLYDFTQDYTMGMWVKFDEYKGFLFRKWQEGEGNFSYWVLDSNIFIAGVSHIHPDWLVGYGHGPRKDMPTGRGYVEGYMDLSQGDIDGWHHIVVARDTTAKTVHLYVDGVLQDTHPGVIQEADGDQVTATMRSDNQSSSDPFRLGEMKGLIDDFFAYDKVLTEGEIKAIYQTGVSQ